MTDLGWPELLIVAAIAMLLFGTKKMPDMARSIGRSMRIVKAELRGLHDDEPVPVATGSTDQPAAAPPAGAGQAAAPTAVPSAASSAAPAAGPYAAPSAAPSAAESERVGGPGRPTDPPTR